MTIALVTNYLTGYRLPLYERLADRYGVEVLCYGGGERYVPSWFSGLDAQLEAATFPARRISGPGEALRLARRYEAAIAPFAGGAMLPATYAGMHRARHPFVLWASVWERPRSPAHDLAHPAIRRIYRHSDAVVAYGEHVKRFVAAIRGRDDDVFVAPQAVEPELFGREVSDAEVADFRATNALGDGPVVLYIGRLMAEKGISELLAAWRALRVNATLVAIGEGPLSGGRCGGRRRRGRPDPAALPAPAARAPGGLRGGLVRWCRRCRRRVSRSRGASCATRRCTQGRPVIATDAVGAAPAGWCATARRVWSCRPATPSRSPAAIDRLLADPRCAPASGRGRRRGASTTREGGRVRAPIGRDRALTGRLSAVAGGYCPTENIASRSCREIHLEGDHRLRPTHPGELRDLAGDDLRELILLTQPQDRDEIPLAGHRVRLGDALDVRPAPRRAWPGRCARPGSGRSRGSCRVRLPGLEHDHLRLGGRPRRRT